MRFIHVINMKWIAKVVSHKDSNGHASERDCLELRLRTCDQGRALFGFIRVV